MEFHGGQDLSMWSLCLVCCIFGNSFTERTWRQVPAHGADSMGAIVRRTSLQISHYTYLRTLRECRALVYSLCILHALTEAAGTRTEPD